MKTHQQQLIEQADGVSVKQELNTDLNVQSVSCGNFSESVKLARRMDRLIQARNFQCKEFNKWSMYFMVAIGALFVGFYYLWASETDYRYHIKLPFVVACTGYLFCMFWHWSNKGYYFWMLNWIKLIMKTEEKMKEDEKVYSVMGITNSEMCDYLCFLSSANISTSKIVIFMSFVTMVIWGFIVLLCARVAFQFLAGLSMWPFVFISLFISFVNSVGVNIFSCVFKSSISNHKQI